MTNIYGYPIEIEIEISIYPNVCRQNKFSANELLTSKIKDAGLLCNSVHPNSEVYQY